MVSIKFRCNFFEVRNSDSASFCEIFVMSIESKCCKHGQYLSISDRYERSKQLQLKNIMKKHGHKQHYWTNSNSSKRKKIILFFFAASSTNNQPKNQLKKPNLKRKPLRIN
jgi:hypothetical protein